MELLLVAATASPRLHSLFAGESVVLQRDVSARVWGTRPPSSSGPITVRLGGHSQIASVAADGGWSAHLPPHAASWGERLTVADASGSSTAVVRFGEAILCSGQSNMGMPVAPWLPCCSQTPRPATCHCFSADNGTAEVAAAGRYTGKISLASVQGRMPNGSYCPYPWTNHSCRSRPEWNAVVPGLEGGTLPGFSALCWYTGRTMFEQLGGRVPVGLMAGAVGGSPIEFWLPRGHVNNSLCGVDNPPCDTGGPHGYKDGDFFEQLIEPFQPFTVGHLLWDQAERDVHCLPRRDGSPGPENRTGICGRPRAQPPAPRAAHPPRRRMPAAPAHQVVAGGLSLQFFVRGGADAGLPRGLRHLRPVPTRAASDAVSADCRHRRRGPCDCAAHLRAHPSRAPPGRPSRPLGCRIWAARLASKRRNARSEAVRPPAAPPRLPARL